MPKALSKYVPGQPIELECYHHSCDGVASLNGVLADDQTRLLYHGFRGSERFTWSDGTAVKDFGLKKDVRCPHCRSNFSSAIIVSQGAFKKPIIFGYESEAC